MKFKRLICYALVCLLAVIMTACKNSKDVTSGSLSETTRTQENNKSRNYLSLLYSASDTFNPYTLKTDVNRQLCKLLYEPLVKVNNKFEPVNALASSVEIGSNSCMVTLKDAKFSDGSSVTAQDVVYSYNLAKNSGTIYASQLYSVNSAEVNGSSVIFYLSKNDPYFANVLDFPIIKKDSDTVTDSDSVILPPIGCGRFKLNSTSDGLIINEGYYGKLENIKEIKLINAPDGESVAHYTEIGAADMYYTDISDGEITRMSGNRQEINLNNLVYIGINQNYAPLNEQPLRQALSSAVDRIKLCEKAYYNNAVAATGFFHPKWKETKSVQNLEIEANSKITVENLEEIGYNRLDSSGIRVNSNGTPLKFTLTVNTENRIKVLAANTVAEQLRAVGIGITVLEKPYDQYMADITSGNFQLYLGEIKFTPNMDVSPLFVKDSSAAFGLPVLKTEESMEPVITSSQTVLEEFYRGNATVKDVASVLQTEMTVVPLCYRTGVLFYNKSIKNVNDSSVDDIYFSIESYLIN